MTRFRLVGDLCRSVAASKQTIAVALGTAIPSGAVLVSAGVLHGREFVHQLMQGSSNQVIAVVLAAGAGALGTLALKQKATSEKQEGMLTALQNGQREMQSAQQIDGVELRRLLTGHLNSEKIVNRLLHDNEKHVREIERLSTRSYEEDDTPSLWRTAPNSFMLSFNGMANSETEENLKADGMAFQATKWAEETWLPRITVGTNLTEWRIALPVPKLIPAFDSLALYPARKLVAVLDDLVKVAKRRGITTTLDHIRVSIVRNVNPSHQFSSVHWFTRQTDDGLVPTVITYHRPHSRRAIDFNNGKVTVHPGIAEQEYWKGIAEGYFYGGVQMSVSQLRQALIDGKFPDVAEAVPMVAFGDHFQFG